MTELELITITGGVFSSRKTTTYDDENIALKAFSATVAKFRKSGESALITIRSLGGVAWCLDKVERL